MAGNEHFASESTVSVQKRKSRIRKNLTTNGTIYRFLQPSDITIRLLKGEREPVNVSSYGFTQHTFQELTGETIQRPLVDSKLFLWRDDGLFECFSGSDFHDGLCRDLNRLTGGGFRPVLAFLLTRTDFPMPGRTKAPFFLVSAIASAAYSSMKHAAAFLECALKSKADFLVTGNIHHFPEKKFHRASILTPAEFVSYVVKIIK